MDVLDDEPFSQQLEAWLKSHKPKTMQGLIETFSEKSFAILFLILLAIAAVPLPTGGVTHVFEIIAMLLALELIAGRRTVWLPIKWRRRQIPRVVQTRTLPFLVRMIRKLERLARSRFQGTLENSLFSRLMGLVVLVFCAFAFVAPPLSGLDTLPAIGILLLSLGIILNDVVFVLLGLITGSIGIAITLSVGKAVFKLFS